MTSTDCAKCHSSVTLPLNVTSCRCRQVVYCNNACKKSDYRSHAISCSFTKEKILSIEIYNQTLASTGDEPLAREMVLGPIIQSVQYKDYLKDIKAAQLAPEKKEFFKICEKLRRRQALHCGDRTYPQLQLLDSENFTYPGAARDKDTRESYFAMLILSSDLKEELTVSRMKQQVHNGDRSHPDLVHLDSFVEANDYPGITLDVKTAMCYLVQFPTLFASHLEMMTKKALTHSYSTASPETKQAYDSSYPMEAKLIKISRQLTYPGKTSDIAGARKLPKIEDIQCQIEIMKRKEMVFGEGTTSDPLVLKIRALNLTYPNCATDIRAMFTGWAHQWNVQDTIDSGLRKQSYHDGTLSETCQQFQVLSNFCGKVYYPGIKEDRLALVEKILNYPSLFSDEFDQMKKKYSQYNRMKPLVALCLCLKHGEGHYVYRLDVLRAHIFSYLHLYGERFLYIHSEAKTSGRMSLGNGK